MNSYFYMAAVVILTFFGWSGHGYGSDGFALAALCQKEKENVLVRPRPLIVSRRQWGAKQPLPGIKMRGQYPQLITIHHSATRQKTKQKIEVKMRNLQYFSQKRAKLASGHVKQAWADIPYHYYIAASGRIAEGRDICFAGDTNTNYNTDKHIQIVLEGNFEEELPTKKQLISLRQLVVWEARRWSVSTANIKGHNHYARTACPGKNLKKYIHELRKWLSP